MYIFANPVTIIISGEDIIIIIKIVIFICTSAKQFIMDCHLIKGFH